MTVDDSCPFLSNALDEVLTESSPSPPPDCQETENPSDRPTEIPSPVPHSDTEDVEPPNERKEATFDNLYDDIFEVELPSTLYGVHRDPDRTFIAFTLVDGKSCATAKAVRIDRRLCTKLMLRGRTVQTTEHEDLTVDDIQDILKILDGMSG